MSGSGPLLVTGAANGIGKAVAELAIRRGQSVAMLDVDRARLTGTAGALRGSTSAEVMAIPCDVTDDDAIDAAFEAATQQLGTPTGIVTAAGVDRGGDLRELDAATWDEVLAINLRGTFLACRGALRRMSSGAGGAIVCVSSPLAFVATPGGSAAYSASKAGISALVRSLAVDHAGGGIRINALLPGPTETDLMWARVPETEIDRVRAVIAAEVPLGRLAQPLEIAGAALWLLSDEASYVTGAQVPCDGGVLAKAAISV